MYATHIFKDWCCTSCGKKAGLKWLDWYDRKTTVDRLCDRCWIWATLVVTGKAHDKETVDQYLVEGT